MAARDHAHAQRLLDHRQVIVHRLLAVLVQLEVDVVVGDRGQDAGLAQAHVLGRLRDRALYSILYLSTGHREYTPQFIEVNIIRQAGTADQ